MCPIKEMGEFGGQNAHSTLKPIASQEFKVRIEITCNYDGVFLIHVDTCSTTPPPPPPRFENSPFTPPPPIIQPRRVFSPKNPKVLSCTLFFLPFF